MKIKRKLSRLLNLPCLILYFAFCQYYVIMDYIVMLTLQVSEAGVHRPHVGGIHGRSNDGSYSLVLAGGFEDEVVGYLYFLLDIY